MADNLPYCPRCTCEFCTAQRAFHSKLEQRTFEREDQAERERQASEEAEARRIVLNDRQSAMIWMLVLLHPPNAQRDAVRTVAALLEMPPSMAGNKVRTYAARLGERIESLSRDMTGPIRRLRAAGAIPTECVDLWAKQEKAYLPAECDICGGFYTEGRHCKRNSCRRKRRKR